jgi:phosphoribosylformylglycinamidine (FGAM) synthase-like enzyme
MMLSESQERMLMVLKPGKEAFAEAIFHKWELDFAVIGEVTDTGGMVLFHGETVCDIPLGPLADDAPLYDRPHVPTPKRAPLADIPACADLGADLREADGQPRHRLARWIWEQYDNKVGGDTRAGAGRRRCGRACPWHRQGAGDQHRLHPALLLRRSGRGRQAGSGGMLAQHHMRSARCRSPSPTV